MDDATKKPIIIVVVILAVALAGFMMFKFMNPGAADMATVKIEAKAAEDKTKDAPAADSARAGAAPTGATLPPGKGKHF